MSIMVLGEFLYDCPIYWRNYLDYLEGIHPKSVEEGFPESVLNEYLKPFGGRYLESKDADGYPYYRVEFPDEKRYFLFKLKYGDREK